MEVDGEDPAARTRRFLACVSCFFSFPFPSCPFISYIVHMLQLINGFTFNFPIPSFVLYFPGLFFKMCPSVNQHHRHASCMFIFTYCTAMRLLEFTISCACNTTLIVAGICVALSNFSSVLLPCLCTFEPHTTRK